MRKKNKKSKSNCPPAANTGPKIGCVGLTLGILTICMTGILLGAFNSMCQELVNAASQIPGLNYTQVGWMGDIYKPGCVPPEGNNATNVAIITENAQANADRKAAYRSEVLWIEALVILGWLILCCVVVPAGRCVAKKVSSNCKRGAEDLSGNSLELPVVHNPALPLLRAHQQAWGHSATNIQSEPSI